MPHQSYRAYRDYKIMLSHYYRANKDRIRVIIGVVFFILVLQLLISLFSSNEYVLREADGADEAECACR